MTDLPHSYVKRVILGKVGKQAMKLASRVAEDLVNQQSIEYLQVYDESTNILLDDKKCFAQELKKYVDGNRELWQNSRGTKGEDNTQAEG